MMESKEMIVGLTKALDEVEKHIGILLGNITFGQPFVTEWEFTRLKRIYRHHLSNPGECFGVEQVKWSDIPVGNVREALERLFALHVELTDDIAMIVIKTPYLSHVYSHPTYVESKLNKILSKV